MNREHQQSSYAVRFDWGLTGAQAVDVSVDVAVDVAVVVDVLSFTTTLSVAVDAGVTVLPYPWRDGRAADFARDHDAVLAVGRTQAAEGQISLSPGTLRITTPPRRLVLPSPNGSTIAHALASNAGVVVGASLRNAAAVAHWISENYAATAVIAVIAAGERWPDGSLRPAIEDLWGAGAVLSALAGNSVISPEARVAAEAWSSVRPRIQSSLNECASGRELIAMGFDDDVAIAGEIDQSSSVPVLAGGEFSAV